MVFLQWTMLLLPECLLSTQPLAASCRANSVLVAASTAHETTLDLGPTQEAHLKIHSTRGPYPNQPNLTIRYPGSKPSRSLISQVQILNHTVPFEINITFHKMKVWCLATIALSHKVFSCITKSEVREEHVALERRLLVRLMPHLSLCLRRNPNPEDIA